MNDVFDLGDILVIAMCFAIVIVTCGFGGFTGAAYKAEYKVKTCTE